VLHEWPWGGLALAPLLLLLLVAVCFACTLRNLSPQESSALLLREVYDFTVEETASVMGVTFGPVKAWIQSARDAHRAVRRELRARRQAGSVLSVRRTRSGLRRAQGDPLVKTRRDVDARLVVLRARRDAPLGPWHRKMMRIVDEVLDESVSLEVSPSRCGS
jgi:hypothetical protein